MVPLRNGDPAYNHPMHWQRYLLLPFLLTTPVGAKEIATTDTPVGPLSLPVVPDSLLVSPDSSRLVLAAMSNPTLADKGIMIGSQGTDPRNDSARPVLNPISLYVDGKPTIACDSFAPPVFSPDSQHLAWAGLQGKTWRLVLDGKTLAQNAADVPATPIVFSPDSARVALAVRKDEALLITAGTQAWPPQAASALGQMAFSPDSRHLAAVALTNAGWRLLVDGTLLPLPPAPASSTASGPGRAAAASQAAPRLQRFTQFVWRPDSSGLAYYAAFTGGTWQVFSQPLEGELSYASPPCDAIMKVPPVFAPDSQRMAVAVESRNKWTVVPAYGAASMPATALQGAPIFDQVLPQSIAWFQPAGAPDQRFVRLYLAQQNKKWRLYADDRPADDAFDAILLGSFALSPDRHHYAYAGIRDGQTIVIRDGATLGTHSECGSQSFAFSPDSRHLAYSARFGATWSACVDGTPGASFQQMAAEPIAFAPDSSRIAYVALTGAGNWRLIVGQDGGLQSKPYDGFIKGSHVNWRPDGSIVTLGILKKVACRIEAKP